MLLEMTDLDVLTSFTTVESSTLNRKEQIKEQNKIDNFIFRKRKLREVKGT